MDWFHELTRIDISTTTEMPYLLVVVKLLCSILAGTIIGIERSLNGRPVGIRTYAIVCMASVACVTMMQHLPLWIDNIPNEVYKEDTSRGIMAIITGITFLCSGVVMRTGFSIQGLTTATSIWMASIIGVLFGVGFFFIGAASVVGTVVILTLFKLLEDRISAGLHARLCIVYKRNSETNRHHIFALLKENQIEPIGTINHKIINDGQDDELSVTLRGKKHEGFTRFARALRVHHEFKSYRLHFTER